MNYINRREMGSDTNEKPFNARQTGKTMIKYAAWWALIVRYIWRTHELEVVGGQEERVGEEKEDSESGEKGVRGKRPRYQMTAGQMGWLYKIKQIVGEDKEEAEDAEHGSDEEEGEEEEEEGEEEFRERRK